ncbi:MAG: pyruvate kinase [Acutalibacteraceae bacterium]
MRKTKIICTMGPACNSEEKIRDLCLAGMNVARLNFSHGSHEEHKQTMDRIKKVREKLGLPIAILLDTKGPEYRIGTFKNKKVTVETGGEFTFVTDDVVGDETKVSVSYKHLPLEMNEGDVILVNDGLVSFEVVETGENFVRCTVTTGGILSDRKSMAFPGKVLEQEFLSEQDKSDLLFGIENDIDYVAASFVSSGENISDIKKFLAANGGEDIDVIAKIENRSGVDNIREICENCEGIMVARGDLGVEIPFEELPAVQKKLITTCRLMGRRVITATEMLESMTTNIRPTRAEISDVANAVYDGTSAVMLSGETAIGAHPAKVVETMSSICLEAEKNIPYNKRFFNTEFEIKSNIDAVSYAACSMALTVHAKAITVCSMSGKSARMVSRFRPDIDILGFTTSEKAWRKLSLSWGVLPVITEEFTSTEVIFYAAAKATAKTLNLSKGDNVIVVGATVSGRQGFTNDIRLETI